MSTQQFQHDFCQLISRLAALPCEKLRERKCCSRGRTREGYEIFLSGWITSGAKKEKHKVGTTLSLSLSLSLSEMSLWSTFEWKPSKPGVDEHWTWSEMDTKVKRFEICRVAGHHRRTCLWTLNVDKLHWRARREREEREEETLRSFTPALSHMAGLAGRRELARKKEVQKLFWQKM